MQRFNMEVRKYRGVISPITATSIGQATQEKVERPFIRFRRMMEVSPKKRIQGHCSNGNNIITI